MTTEWEGKMDRVADETHAEEQTQALYESEPKAEREPVEQEESLVERLREQQDQEGTAALERARAELGGKKQAEDDEAVDIPLTDQDRKDLAGLSQRTQRLTTASQALGQRRQELQEQAAQSLQKANVQTLSELRKADPGLYAALKQEAAELKRFENALQTEKREVQELWNNARTNAQQLKSEAKQTAGRQKLFSEYRDLADDDVRDAFVRYVARQTGRTSGEIAAMQDLKQVRALVRKHWGGFDKQRKARRGTVPKAQARTAQPKSDESPSIHELRHKHGIHDSVNAMYGLPKGRAALPRPRAARDHAAILYGDK